MPVYAVATLAQLYLDLLIYQVCITKKHREQKYLIHTITNNLLALINKNNKRMDKFADKFQGGLFAGGSFCFFLYVI